MQFLYRNSHGFAIFHKLCHRPSQLITNPISTCQCPDLGDLIVMNASLASCEHLVQEICNTSLRLLVGNSQHAEPAALKSQYCRTSRIHSHLISESIVIGGYFEQHGNEAADSGILPIRFPDKPLGYRVQLCYLGYWL
jgi:hypothetical protein